MISGQTNRLLSHMFSNEEANHPSISHFHLQETSFVYKLLEIHSSVVTKIHAYFWKCTISVGRRLYGWSGSFLNHNCHLLEKSGWLISQQTSPEWVLIFAFLGILLLTAEQKNGEPRTWRLRDKYLTGNKHLGTHEKRKKKTHTFLTTMYHGISSTRSLQRNREKDGETRKKEAQTGETNKRKSFW